MTKIQGLPPISGGNNTPPINKQPQEQMRVSEQGQGSLSKQTFVPEKQAVLSDKTITGPAPSPIKLTEEQTTELYNSFIHDIEKFLGQKIPEDEKIKEAFEVIKLSIGKGGIEDCRKLLDEVKKKREKVIESILENKFFEAEEISLPMDIMDDIVSKVNYKKSILSSYPKTLTTKQKKQVDLKVQIKESDAQGYLLTLYTQILSPAARPTNRQLVTDVIKSAIFGSSGESSPASRRKARIESLKQSVNSKQPEPLQKLVREGYFCDKGDEHNWFKVEWKGNEILDQGNIVKGEYRVSRALVSDDLKKIVAVHEVVIPLDLSDIIGRTDKKKLRIIFDCLQNKVDKLASGGDWNEVIRKKSSEQLEIDINEFENRVEEFYKQIELQLTTLTLSMHNSKLNHLIIDKRLNELQNRVIEDFVRVLANVPEEEIKKNLRPSIDFITHFDNTDILEAFVDLLSVNKRTVPRFLASQYKKNISTELATKKTELLIILQNKEISKNDHETLYKLATQISGIIANKFGLLESK